MFAKSLLILCSALLVTACGFHPRGEYAVPSSLKNVYLEGGSYNLRDQVAKVIRPAAGHFPTQAIPDGVTIKLFSEQSNSRVLSLNDRGRSNELELYYHLEYEILSGRNEMLLPRQALEIKREYFNNQSDILAKDYEQTMIRNEMYEQAAHTIINRARVVLNANDK